MLLAASPGGTTANLFSHLFGGDVALNVTLTAINAVVAIATLPVITNFALLHFEPGIGQDGLGLQFDKRAPGLRPGARTGGDRPGRAPALEAFALRMDRPVRLLSVVVLVAVIVGAVLAERSNIVGFHLADAGPVALALLCAEPGHGVLRAPYGTRVGKRQAIACSMEIGVHNSTVAMTLAISVLGSVSLAVPAAVYGVLAYPVAALAGLLMTRVGTRLPAEESVRAA